MPPSISVENFSLTRNEQMKREQWGGVNTISGREKVKEEEETVGEGLKGTAHKSVSLIGVHGLFLVKYLLNLLVEVSPISLRKVIKDGVQYYRYFLLWGCNRIKIPQQALSVMFSL